MEWYQEDVKGWRGDEGNGDVERSGKRSVSVKQEWWRWLYLIFYPALSRPTFIFVLTVISLPHLSSILNSTSHRKCVLYTTLGDDLALIFTCINWQINWLPLVIIHTTVHYCNFIYIVKVTPSSPPTTVCRRIASITFAASLLSPDRRNRAIYRKIHKMRTTIASNR